MGYRSKYSGLEIETILDSVDTKQDKLVTGEGIKIEGNTISCNLDTSLYRIVSELPETGDSELIYLVELDKTGERNLYQEYIFVNNVWEELGKQEIDLSSYLTKTEAEETYQPKGDYLTGNDQKVFSMKTYIVDFSGTYTQNEIENKFGTTFEKLIRAIKDGLAIVITSSDSISGNYNFIWGATYTLTDDGTKFQSLTLMWCQYSQWITLTLTYNADSDNYSVTNVKTTI